MIELTEIPFVRNDAYTTPFLKYNKFTGSIIFKQVSTIPGCHSRC